ncbi:CBS domain-containing protein [Mucisphaera sp.]|uniref:CBS domain-containing protein n=1 Tax=Mucisphaera sp. TaxID=2913024 RepID=UPI003D0D0B18
MSTVQQILDRKGNQVYTVSPDTTIDRAAQAMTEHNIGSLLCVGRNGLLGIITERDTLRKVIAQQLDPATTTVREAMTANVWTCTPDTSLEDLSDVFKDRRIRHLPVIGNEGQLLGVVSLGDLNAFRLEGQAVMIEYLHQYLHGVG